MSKYTISVSQGRVAEHHDKREYYPDNAKDYMQQDNKTLVTTPDYAQAFRDYFADSVAEYNAKQKRKDRKKTDYLSEIADGDGKENPFYEYVIQIGNCETNGTLNDSEEAMKCREVLDSAMEKLQDKYPSFKFWFIGSHGDEPNGTYHYHICFTPVGTGYKDGMQKRCSLSKALENMGFPRGKGKPYPIDLWKQDVEKHIEQEMVSNGLERDYKNEHRRRLDIDDYRRSKMIETIEEKQAEIDDYEVKLKAKASKVIKKDKAVSSKQKELEEREKEIARKEQELDKLIEKATVTIQYYDDISDNMSKYLETVKPLYDKLDKQLNHNELEIERKKELQETVEEITKLDIPEPVKGNEIQEIAQARAEHYKQVDSEDENRYADKKKPIKKKSIPVRETVDIEKPKTLEKARGNPSL